MRFCLCMQKPLWQLEIAGRGKFPWLFWTNQYFIPTASQKVNTKTSHMLVMLGLGSPALRVATALPSLTQDMRLREQTASCKTQQSVGLWISSCEQPSWKPYVPFQALPVTRGWLKRSFTDKQLIQMTESRTVLCNLPASLFQHVQHFGLEYWINSFHTDTLEHKHKHTHPINRFQSRLVLHKKSTLSVLMHIVLCTTHTKWFRITDRNIAHFLSYFLHY